MASSPLLPAGDSLLRAVDGDSPRALGEDD